MGFEGEEKTADQNQPKLFQNIFVQLLHQQVEVVENERLEIKGWCRDEKEFAEKMVESASCLANAKGGMVLGGVGGKRAIFSACPYPNVNAAWIETRIKDQSVPPVECEVFDLADLLESVRGVHGAHAFGIVIPQTKFLTSHITTGGISKIRVGKECKPYFTTADDDRTRSIANNVSGTDLSLTSIQWAISRHQSKFNTSGAVEDPFEFLARMRLIEQKGCGSIDPTQCKITLAALILFGKEAAINRVLSHFETVISFGGEHLRLRQNVVESVRELVLSEKSVIRRRCPQVSREMLQELLMNAYMHRCWRTAAPIMIHLGDFLEIQNPGDLMPGLHASNLLHCIPSYRNFLLAESSRFIGLCDKLGKGIGVVFESALRGGLDIPVFESENNCFTARLSLVRSDHFREFIRVRAASLSSMDEILTLRTCWSMREAGVQEIAQVLQRGFAQTELVLKGMEKKQMIERAGPQTVTLAPSIRTDIEHIFERNQLSLDLFGA